jgi:Domain of unknown function (DUF1905)
VQVVFDAELWLWDARRTDAWTFVGLPAGESEEIRDLAGGLRRGFGSLRVRATIGSSTWTTSIFPGKTGYVLPVKRSIRVAEALDVGDTATVTVELIDFALPDPLRCSGNAFRPDRISGESVLVGVGDSLGPVAYAGLGE